MNEELNKKMKEKEYLILSLSLEFLMLLLSFHIPRLVLSHIYLYNVPSKRNKENTKSRCYLQCSTKIRKRTSDPISRYNSFQLVS